MSRTAPRLMLVCALLICASVSGNAQQTIDTAAVYSCPPCGCPGDTAKFKEAGNCPDCGMLLVKDGSQTTVAVLLYPGVELLDFTGPFEVFSTAMGLYDVYAVARSEQVTNTGMGALSIVPSYSFDNCPQPDIFVIPGGAAGRVTQDSASMEFIKKTCSGAETVLSVCNGSFILLQAGLLDGLKATAHEQDLDDIRQYATNTEFVAARFVDNGKYVTAGGVSSGIDGALRIIERMHGQARADNIARYLQHVRRSGLIIEPVG